MRTRRIVAGAGSITAMGMSAALVFTGVPSVEVAGPVGPSRSPAATAASAHANPLIQRAVFGWLPGDYGEVTAVMDRQPRWTFELTAVSGDLTQPIRLTDYGSGAEPPLGFLHGGERAKRIPAAPVNGHPAYWIAKPGTQDGGRLRWRYGPKSWAELEVTRGANDTTETIHLIAKAVKFGGTGPMRFPIRVSKIPGGLYPYRAVRRTAPTSAALGFRSKEPGELAISVEDDNMSSRGGLLPNTSIDGHAAYDSRLGPAQGSPKPGGPNYGKPTGGSNGQQLWVFGVQGFDVRLDASGDALRQLASTGGLTGLFRRITVLGDDMNNWTTTPLG